MNIMLVYCTTFKPKIRWLVSVTEMFWFVCLLIIKIILILLNVILHFCKFLIHFTGLIFSLSNNVNHFTRCSLLDVCGGIYRQSSNDISVLNIL